MAPYLVDMFFLFSGFVIAFACEPRLRSGKMDAREFIRQRMIRLLPLFALGILLGLAVRLLALLGDQTINPGQLALEIIPQLFMLPSLAPPTPDTALYTLNAACWSLFFEVFASFAFIVLWPWVKSTRVLAGVVAVFAIALAVSIYAYGDLRTGFKHETFLGGFARAGFGFFLGGLVYRLMKSPQKPPVETSWLALLALPPIFVLYTMTLPEDSRQLGQLMLALFLGPVWLIFGLMMQPPKFLHGISLRLGIMSYAIYVVHTPVLLLVERLGWGLSQKLSFPLYLMGPVMLIASLGLAYVAEKYYDRPVRKWLLSATKRKPAKAPASLAV